MSSKTPIPSSNDILHEGKALGSDEKIELFKERYEDLVLSFRNKEMEYNGVKRDLANLTVERNKQHLALSRLEGACRELQKQNRNIKDLSLAKILEEEEKRKKLTEEFQKSLDNVTAMMTESNLQNTKLGEENRKMAERLKSIYEEFKTRETEVDRISSQIDMERQLAEARCAKLKAEFLIEKQQIMGENDALSGQVRSLTRDLHDSTKKCTVLQQQVTDLTAQIEKYTGKYEEFENTISRSGRVFDHCKSEISKMNKQLNAYKKEVAEWQTRYQKAAGSLYEAQIETTDCNRMIDDLTKKISQLTKLCRELQKERQLYLLVLRKMGVDPADIVVVKPEDKPATEEVTKPPTNNETPDVTDGNKLGAKPKSMATGAKQQTKGGKGKKGNKGSSNVSTPPGTLKEIELANLKQELKRVQAVMDVRNEAEACLEGHNIIEVEVPADLVVPQIFPKQTNKDATGEASTTLETVESEPIIAEDKQTIQCNAEADKKGIQVAASTTVEEGKQAIRLAADGDKKDTEIIESKPIIEKDEQVICDAEKTDEGASGETSSIETIEFERIKTIPSAADDQEGIQVALSTTVEEGKQEIQFAAEGDKKGTETIESKPIIVEDGQAICGAQETDEGATASFISVETKDSEPAIKSDEQKVPSTANTQTYNKDETKILNEEEIELSTIKKSI